MPLPANVAIDDIVPITFATGNGTTDEYPFTWWVDEAANIDVYVGNTPDGALGNGPLTLNTHYTVDLATEPAVGGTVTFLPDYIPTASQRVVIVRSMPLDRLTDFPSAGKLESRVLNSDLDAAVAMIQQQREDIRRSLHFPITKMPSEYESALPLPAALRLLGWDAEAKGLANYTFPTVATPFPDGFHDIRSYGALGDGGDDYQAIQDAIDGAAGQVLIIPPGVWEIGTAPLILDHDFTKVLCFGTIKVKPGAMTPARDGGDLNATCIVNIRHAQGCLWDGGILDGNNAYAPNGMGISHTTFWEPEFAGAFCYRNVVRNVIIQNCIHDIPADPGGGTPHDGGYGNGGGKGVTVQFGSPQTILEDIRILNCTTGISYEGGETEERGTPDLIVDNMTIDSCMVAIYGVGIFGASVDADDLGADYYSSQWSNITIINCGVTKVPADIDTDPDYHGIINALPITNMRMSGLTVRNSTGSPTVFRGIFRNCHFDGIVDARQIDALFNGTRNINGGVPGQGQSPTRHCTFDLTVKLRGAGTPGDQITGTLLTDAGGGNVAVQNAFRLAMLVGDGANNYHTNNRGDLTSKMFGGAQPHPSNVYEITDLGSSSRNVSTINVRDYGAVGDGVANDLPAFQAALDAAQITGNNRVYVPAGTYHIEGNALEVFTDEVFLEGAGADCTIIEGAVAGTADVEETEIIDVRKSFRVEGIWFKNMGAVVYLRNVPANTVLDYITVRHCKFTNCGAGVYWNDLQDPNPDSGIVALTIEGNYVDTCARGFFVGCEIIRRGHVLNNTILTVRRKAIQIGVNFPVDRTDPVEIADHRIIGNIIEGVTDPDGIDAVYESNAIIVHGRYAAIIGNVVKSVTTFTTDNSEGIYTKVRAGIIANNTLVNAGENHGAIAIKGSTRTNPTGRQPYGYGVVVIGNNIYSDNALFRNGIFVSTDDVLVANNYCEGMAGPAVRVESDSTDEDHHFRNIAIRGNLIRNIIGKYAISVEAQVDGLTIEDNVIDSILDTFAGTGGYGAGIQLATYDNYATGLKRVRVRGNRIRGLAAGLTNGRAIWIAKDTTKTVTDVEICDNEIDTVYEAGISIGGDDPIPNLRILRNRVVNVTTAGGDIARTGTADYSGAGAIIKDNYGDFVNENAGVATLQSGNTEVTVTHGLSPFGVLQVPAPEEITVTPTESLGSAAFWWVDTITSTTFKIKVNANPGADVDFAWNVRRRVWDS